MDTSTLDATLQQSLALVRDGVAKTEGIRIGQIIAQAILSLRSSRPGLFHAVSSIDEDSAMA